MRVRIRLLSVVFAVACSPRAQDRVACVTAELSGGTDRTDFLGLDPRQEWAIGRLELMDAANRTVGWCSGSFVTLNHVLTAAHCVLQQTLRVDVVVGDGAASERLAVIAVHPHPALDLALLEVAPQLTTPLIPMAAPRDLQLELGDRLQIAGLNGVSAGTFDVQFAVTLVDDVAPTSFRVFAGQRAAACAGDSGGPALVRDAEGRASLVGVLSGGTQSCADWDTYTRTDVARDWLLTVVPPSALDGSFAADCSLVGPQGHCFGETAVWCEAGLPRTQHCTNGSSCGFDPGRNGFRCVPSGDDPCEGIDDFGQCTDGASERCVDGVVVTSPCTACSAQCTYSVTDGRAICNALGDASRPAMP